LINKVTMRGRVRGGSPGPEMHAEEDSMKTRRACPYKEGEGSHWTDAIQVRSSNTAHHKWRPHSNPKKGSKSSSVR